MPHRLSSSSNRASSCLPPPFCRTARGEAAPLSYVSFPVSPRNLSSSFRVARTAVAFVPRQIGSPPTANPANRSVEDSFRCADTFAKARRLTVRSRNAPRTAAAVTAEAHVDVDIASSKRAATLASLEERYRNAQATLKLNWKSVKLPENALFQKARFRGANPRRHKSRARACVRPFEDGRRRAPCARSGSRPLSRPRGHQRMSARSRRPSLPEFRLRTSGTMTRRSRRSHHHHPTTTPHPWARRTPHAERSLRKTSLRSPHSRETRTRFTGTRTPR